MKRPITSRTSSKSRPTISPRQSKTTSTVIHHAWFAHHVYVFFFSLGQLMRTPLATLMTAAVIGIALALPTGLYLLLDNAQRISQSWGGTIQISLFLKVNVDDDATMQLAEKLHEREDIQSVRVITRAEALDEYRSLSGFSDALNALEENPLPAVIVVQPTLDQSNPQANQSLLEKLNKLPEVDVAQFDMVWLKRLFAMMEMARRGILVFASLLALTVLLVVGNTIRLAIYNRREEIEVTKLFGGTDTFIRRPFLYIGFWYGLSGGLIARFLVETSLWGLREPVRKVTALYGSQFELVTLDWRATFILLLAGILLGLIGAWLSVGRHLREIQPK